MDDTQENCPASHARKPLEQDRIFHQKSQGKILIVSKNKRLYLEIEFVQAERQPRTFQGFHLESIIAFLPQLPTLEEIVVWGGYIGLFAIIFAETGLLIGFFLPGDSLLVTAGLFAARGQLDGKQTRSRSASCERTVYSVGWLWPRSTLRAARVCTSRP